MDFDSLGLSPRLTLALNDQGLTDPTPIQEQAIPHAMAGRDVMGLAQTGSGKTAAFGLPMLDAMLKNGQKAPPKGARALVLAPTRELAKQIHDTLAGFAQGSHLKLALITGGASGIGLATARLFLREGARVALLDRNAEVLARLAAELGVPGIPVDVADAAAIDAGDLAVRRSGGQGTHSIA